jgi:exodeoxyribonuclease VII large subunit
VQIYSERSGYQLHVESIEPTGLGSLFLLYERLKEQFRSEGLFEPARKRAIPKLPRRVALVSASGKAVADFRQTIERSVPFVEVLFVETRVQGQGAEIDIAQALDDASRLDVDAIVLTRGGGSYEDLFPFNLEPVVRAIVRAKAPVFTAIGHTEDRHLADEVADLSFGTPSLAAEAIARGWLLAARRLAEADRDLERIARTIVLGAAQRTDAAREKLERAARQVVTLRRETLRLRVVQLERYNPQRTLADVRRRLAGGTEKLNTVAAQFMSRKSRGWSESRERLARVVLATQTNFARRLERSVSALDRADPLAPLARGYAIVSSGGRVVRDAAVLQAGDAIEARLGRGMLDARVESVRGNADDA